MLCTRFYDQKAMPCPRELNFAEESFKIFVQEEYLVDFGVTRIENNPSSCVIELLYLYPFVQAHLSLN